MKQLLGSSAAAAIAFSLTAMPAMAQDSGEAVADVPSQRQLQEIVVTAERRAIGLQEVPIAATVLTAEALEDSGTTSLEGLQSIAPSLSINTALRSTFVNIRGVGGGESNPTNSPGVAVYVDGVLLTQDFFLTQSFYDIATVEVLRGPQGTLTGQNSTGGALYIRTPAPDFDIYSGNLELTAGNYDAYRAVGALNLALSDNVAIRVAGMHDQRDSYTTNLGPSGYTPGNVNMDAGRINLAMRSDDDRLRVNVRADIFDSRNDNMAVKRRDDTNTDPYEIAEDGISFQRQKGHRLSAEANYELGNEMTLRGLISQQKGSTKETGDGDRTDTELPISQGGTARAGINNNDSEVWLAEVNLISAPDGPLTWVIGGFIMEDHLETILNTDRTNISYVSGQALFDLDTKSKSKSLFGQANWFVTEQAELIAGLRHSWNEQTLVANSVAGFTTPPFTGTNFTDSAEFTGKVGINYHATDDLLVYLTGSKGFKAGGNNPVAGQPGFDPEINYVGELGVKSTLLGRRLRINGAVFYSDHQALQAQSTTGIPPLPRVQNSGDARTYGAELEAMVQLGGFSGNLGVTWLDSKYKSDSCVDNSGPIDYSDPACPGRSQLVQAGWDRAYAPEWTVNAAMQYEFLLPGEMAITPRVELAHKGGQQTQPFPSSWSYLPKRTVLNARLTFDVNDSLSIDGFVNNFTDETYIATQLQRTTSSEGGYVYGAPRTYGVRLITSF